MPQALGVGVDVGVDVDMEAVLAGAVQRYLVENAGVIRQARRATVLVWPALGAVTSHFGPDHPLGIDIGQSAGNIVAATDGTVRFAGGDPCCSYGLYAVIDSADGITTVYGHFSSLGVKTGDRVRQGQALGVVGCTGHCFGTHLHFEVIVQGRRVDPLSYLP